jgi:hypothetical protein
MALLFASPALYAQTSIIDISPLSGRLLPTTPSTQAALLAETKQQPVTYLISPLYLKSNGIWLGLIDGAAIFPTAIPLRADLTYTYIKPDAGDSINSYTGTLRATVLSKEKVGGLTVLGSYTNTKDVNNKTQFGAIGEYDFKGTPFSVSGDVRWVRSSRDKSDDIVPKISGALDYSKCTLSADYTFKNDVDGETDYSGEVDIKTGAGILIIGGGKHSTFFVGFARVF